MAVSNMRGILIATAALAVLAIGLAILATIDRFAVARPPPWSRALASEDEALRDTQTPGAQEAHEMAPSDSALAVERPDWNSEVFQLPAASRAAAWPDLDRFLACKSERLRDAARKSGSDDCDDGAANVIVGAMEWTRARILTFESRVMTRNIAVPGGASAGNTTVLLHSLFPGHTQHGAYAFDKRFANAAVLAQLGVLLTPFYMFSGTTALHVAADTETPTPAPPEKSQFGFQPTARGARMRIREAQDTWEHLAARAQQNTGAPIDDASPSDTLHKARNSLETAWRKVFHSMEDSANGGLPASSTDTRNRGTKRRLLEFHEQAREASDASTILQDTKERLERIAPEEQHLEDGDPPPEIGNRAANAPATDGIHGAQIDGGSEAVRPEQSRRAWVDTILARHVAGEVRAANHASDVAAWNSWSSLAGIDGVFSNASTLPSRSAFANPQEPSTGATLPATFIAADGSRLLGFPYGNIESWLHQHVKCAFAAMVDPALHDLDRLRESIDSQGKYPRLARPLRARSKRGVRDALVGTAARQAIPHVLTAFNVMVDARGHLYSSTRLSGAFPIQPPGRAFSMDDQRRGDGTTVLAQTSFRPTMCWHDSPLSEHSVREALPSERISFVDEVIVLTQHWGDAVFHFWRECLMRLLLMIDYVRAYKHVRIHVPQSDREEFLVGVDRPGRLIREAFALLGIHPARIITGHVFARIVHVPEGTPCGQPYVISDLLARELWRRAAGLPAILDLWRIGEPRLSSDAASATVPAQQTSPVCGEGSARSWVVRAQDQAMSALHSCIAEWTVQAEHEGAGIGQQPSMQGGSQVVDDEIPLTPDLPRMDALGQGNCSLRVLIIERAPGTRYVKNHFALAGALRSIPGVTLETFSAHQLPSARETIHIFAGADVIVAPHGAGLTNMLFSGPGQVVIELLAREYQTNLVFMQQALALGLQHHAFVPAHAQTDGTIVAEIDRVTALVAALAGATTYPSLVTFYTDSSVSLEHNAEAHTSSSWALAFGVLLVVTVVAITYVMLSQPATTVADVAGAATAPLQAGGASDSSAFECSPKNALPGISDGSMTEPVLQAVETRTGMDRGGVASCPSSGGSAITANGSGNRYTGSHAVGAPAGHSRRESESASWGWGMDDDATTQATTPPSAATHPALAVVGSSTYAGSSGEPRGGLQALQDSIPSGPMPWDVQPTQESKCAESSAAGELRSVRAVSSDADWSQVSSNAGETWSDIHAPTASERGTSSGSSDSRSPLATSESVPVPSTWQPAQAHVGAVAPQIYQAPVSRDSSGVVTEDTAAAPIGWPADQQSPPTDSAPRWVSRERTSRGATATTDAPAIASGWDDWEANTWE